MESLVSHNSTYDSSRQEDKCDDTDAAGCLVYGYTAVGDVNSVDDNTETTQKPSIHTLGLCEEMVWFADGIVRDAVADVRFEIAKSMQQ